MAHGIWGASQPHLFLKPVAVLAARLAPRGDIGRRRPNGPSKWLYTRYQGALGLHFTLNQHMGHFHELSEDQVALTESGKDFNLHTAKDDLRQKQQLRNTNDR